MGGSLQAVPKPISIAVGVICGAVLLSALAGVGLSATRSPPIWFVFGFEALTAFAAVIGLLFSLGRFRDGPAMCLLCVAGAVGVCSLLGYQAAGKIPGVSLYPWLLGRGAAAVLLAGLAGLDVLARDPRNAVPDLVRGAILILVLVGSVIGLWAARGGIQSMPGWLQFVVWLIAGVWLLALMAPAVHVLVRAFDRSPIEADEVRADR